MPAHQGGRAPVWKEGGVLFTVRYVRSPDEAGPGTQVDVPLVRVPVRYEPRDAFENDVRDAWPSRCLGPALIATACRAHAGLLDGSAQCAP